MPRGSESSRAPVVDGDWLDKDRCNGGDGDSKGAAAVSALETIVAVVDTKDSAVAAVGESFWDVDLEVKYLVKVFATLYGPTLCKN